MKFNKETIWYIGMQSAKGYIFGKS